MWGSWLPAAGIPRQFDGVRREKRAAILDAIGTPAQGISTVAAVAPTHRTCRKVTGFLWPPAAILRAGIRIVSPLPASNLRGVAERSAERAAHITPCKPVTPCKPPEHSAPLPKKPTSESRSAFPRCRESQRRPAAACSGDRWRDSARGGEWRRSTASVRRRQK